MVSPLPGLGICAKLVGGLGLLTLATVFLDALSIQRMAAIGAAVRQVTDDDIPSLISRTAWRGLAQKIRTAYRPLIDPGKETESFKSTEAGWQAYGELHARVVASPAASRKDEAWALVSCRRAPRSRAAVLA